MELKNLTTNTSESPIHLTRRELDVIQLALQGLPSKEVAEQLFISKRTVDFHLANVYQKLGAKNRIMAIRQATKFGLIAANATV